MTMILRSHPSWSQIDASGTELARTNVSARSPNNAPTVALLTPSAEGFAGHTQTPIALRATATDTDGIQRVDYLVNGNLIGSAYSGDFLFNWYPQISGEFAIVARAFDNAGASGASASRRVIIAEHGLPTLPAIYGNADQYYPMFPAIMKTTFRALSSNPGDPVLNTWSIPGANDVWDFHWPQLRVQYNSDLDLNNTSWERWQRRFNCTNSSSWLYMNSYHQRTSLVWAPGATESNHDSPVSTTRALFDYQGRIYDITNVCGGGIGQPYVPNSVTGQPMRIRVWGLIAGTKKWYWENRSSYSGGLTNTCWLGGGGSSRPAILNSEAWWDQEENWMEQGSGAMDSTGVPNGLDVVLVRDFALGYQAGYAWEQRFLTGSQWRGCSVNTVNYTFPGPVTK